MATRGRKIEATMSSRRRSAIRRLAVHFPLTSIESVVELFREQICQPNCPNLAVLSIVLGAVEHGLTCDTPPSGVGEKSSFPIVELDVIETLYDRFSELLRSTISADELTSCRRASGSTRAVVRRVSDVVWSCLQGSYAKDRAHMQSLHTLLTG